MFSRSMRQLAFGALMTMAGLGLVTAAPSSATTPASCTATQLAVTHTPAQGAAGHGAFVLLFRNKSTTACSIHGYPGLDALNSRGAVMAHAARTLSGAMGGGASTVPTVVVAPGRYASATVEWLNFNPTTSGACPFSTWVAATPANTSHTVRFRVAVSICRLQVHPTLGGTSGNDGFASAQVYWIRGSKAISAAHAYYWLHAREYLAESRSYPTQMIWLSQLIHLPDANQTPAQNAQYHADITALNRFFDTPGLYA